jgi:hypothetical protein
MVRDAGLDGTRGCGLVVLSSRDIEHTAGTTESAIHLTMMGKSSFEAVGMGIARTWKQ